MSMTPFKHVIWELRYYLDMDYAVNNLIRDNPHSEACTIKPRAWDFGEILG